MGQFASWVLFHSLIMCSIVFLLSCLACTGHGRRVQNSQLAQEHAGVDPSEALASILLANKLQTGFTPSSQGIHRPAANPTRASSRPVVMQDRPERRRDIDGGVFTAQEFQDYYTEQGVDWEEKWQNAEPVDPNMKMFDELKVGDIIPEATVIRYTNFGAFMDINAEIDGLCHYTKIPSEVWDELDEGTVLRVAIEKVDPERRQVGLTCGLPGQKVRDDLKSIDELKVGDVIEDAEVRRYTDFGAFMDIKAEVDGLCHISKIPPEVWETLDNGDTLRVTIEKVDLVKNQIGLTAKEPGRPLADLQTGEIVDGVVVKVMPFGCFVEFGAMSNGLVHVSELGDEFVSDINEKVQEGDKVRCRVKEVDLGRERIALSMRDMPME